MKVIIESPTKAIIIESTQEEVEYAKKKLTYTNTSIQFQLSKHIKNRWFKQKNPSGYAAHTKDLNNQLKTCMLQMDRQGNLILFPGSIPLLVGIKVEVVSNQIHYPAFKPVKWLVQPPFEPYPYQSQTVDLFLLNRHCSASLATGLGKTYIIQMLCQRIGLQTIIVTPSASIFNEIYDSMVELFGKELVGGYGDGKKHLGKLFTVCIAKSLTMVKPKSPEEEFFKQTQAMIIDESHTFSSDTLEKVCHGLLADTPYRFFLSATQISNSGKDKLLHSIIGPVVYEKDIGEGIAEGYLCPLQFKVIKVPSMSKFNKNDPITVKRNHLLNNIEIAQKIAMVVNACWEKRQESSLVLVEELSQIALIARYLTVEYGYAHAAAKKEAIESGLVAVDTQEQVLRFNKGEIKCLIGTSCIRTGTNMYPTHHTHNWSGGSSEIVAKQGAMGRSTRKLENSKFKHLHKPKPITTIYDYDIEMVNPKMQDTEKMLRNQLDKRIEFYQESRGEIKHL
jgi:superfamily II DNA or RNA helicase